MKCPKIKLRKGNKYRSLFVVWYEDILKCNEMQWNAMKCNEMQWNAMNCNEMQWNAMKCTTNVISCNLLKKRWIHVNNNVVK